MNYSYVPSTCQSYYSGLNSVDNPYFFQGDPDSSYSLSRDRQAIGYQRQNTHQASSSYSNLLDSDPYLGRQSYDPLYQSGYLPSDRSMQVLPIQRSPHCQFYYLPLSLDSSLQMNVTPCDETGRSPSFSPSLSTGYLGDDLTPLGGYQDNSYYAPDLKSGPVRMNPYRQGKEKRKKDVDSDIWDHSGLDQLTDENRSNRWQGLQRSVPTFQQNRSYRYVPWEHQSGKPTVRTMATTGDVSNHDPLLKRSLYAMIRQHVSEAVERRKNGDIEGARTALEYLCCEYPTCHIIWIELSRLELDLGNVQNSRTVVLQGLHYIPGNETLLEKRVKIEERLRNCDGVLECARQFMATNGTRCMKSIVEAAIVVAKLGYGYRASDLFQNLLQRTMFTQGSVTLDYIRFVFKTEDYQKGLSLLKNTLTKLTKHGPIWFFTFSVLEQDHTVYWKRGDIASRPRNRDLTYHLDQALECLPNELQWKVYYIAAQAQLRSFTHIRLWTRMKKRYLREYCMTYPEVVRLCFDYLKKCVLLCPEDYQWKVWLLAGRVLGLAGRRMSAIKVREW